MQRTHWWVDQMKEMDAIAMDAFIKDMIESDHERQIQELQEKEREILLKYKEKERIAREKLNILKKSLEQEINEIIKERNRELLKLQMGCMDTWKPAGQEIFRNKSTSTKSTK